MAAQLKTLKYAINPMFLAAAICEEVERQQSPNKPVAEDIIMNACIKAAMLVRDALDGKDMHQPKRAEAGNAIVKKLGTHTIRELQDGEVYHCLNGCGFCHKVTAEENIKVISDKEEVVLEREYTVDDVCSECKGSIGIWDNKKDEEVIVEYLFTPEEDARPTGELTVIVTGEVKLDPESGQSGTSK